MKRLRRAVTLIEVLVVVAIIGVLLGLLVPAVQQARETARRAHCISNLSQLGKALQGFEAVNKKFPSALRMDGLGSFSPHAYLLPYLEQESQYARIDFDVDVFFPVLVPNASDIDQGQIAICLCPSDGQTGEPGNNYRGCTGPDPYVFKTPQTPDGGQGAFAAREQFAPAHLTDGLSTTVGMSERLIGGFSAAKFDRRRDFWYSGAYSLLGRQPTRDEMVKICDSLSVAPVGFHEYSGLTWLSAGFENTWYNHTVAPNSSTPDCSMDSWTPGLRSDTHGGVFQATSYHPGGVNCLYLDGAVRFASDTVDLGVWRAIATRAGNETLDLASL